MTSKKDSKAEKDSKLAEELEIYFFGPPGPREGAGAAANEPKCRNPPPDWDAFTSRLQQPSRPTLVDSWELILLAEAKAIADKGKLLNMIDNASKMSFRTAVWNLHADKYKIYEPRNASSSADGGVSVLPDVAHPSQRNSGYRKRFKLRQSESCWLIQAFFWLMWCLGCSREENLNASSSSSVTESVAAKSDDERQLTPPPTLKPFPVHRETDDKVALCSGLDFEVFFQRMKPQLSNYKWSKEFKKEFTFQIVLRCDNLWRMFLDCPKNDSMDSNLIGCREAFVIVYDILLLAGRNYKDIIKVFNAEYKAEPNVLDGIFNTLDLMKTTIATLLSMQELILQSEYNTSESGLRGHRCRKCFSPNTGDHLKTYPPNSCKKFLDYHVASTFIRRFCKHDSACVYNPAMMKDCVKQRFDYNSPKLGQRGTVVWEDAANQTDAAAARSDVCPAQGAIRKRTRFVK